MTLEDTTENILEDVDAWRGSIVQVEWLWQPGLPRRQFIAELRDAVRITSILVAVERLVSMEES